MPTDTPLTLKTWADAQVTHADPITADDPKEPLS